MCFVLILVFTLSLVSDVLPFSFTTHTQFQVQSSFLLAVAVRLCPVIVNSDCTPNSCIFHIAKTGPLRSCPSVLHVSFCTHCARSRLLRVFRRGESLQGDAPLDPFTLFASFLRFAEGCHAWQHATSVSHGGMPLYASLLQSAGFRAW